MIRRIILFFTLFIFSLCSLHTLDAEEKIESNDQIFFSEITKGSGRDLGTRYYLYDLDKKVKKELKSRYLKDVYNGMPRVSLNGQFLVFFSKDDNQTFLKLIDLKNNIEILSKKVPIYSGMLFVSHDNSCFTFCSNSDRWKSSTKEVYIFDVRTDSIKQVTENNVYDYSPIISPNHESLVYLQMENTKKTVLKRYYFESGETKNVKTFNNTGYNMFQWLENDKILLTRKENSGTPFLLDLKTGETNDLFLDKIYDIKISSDGKRVLYLQAPVYEDPTWSLYVSDIDGENVVKIPQEKNIDIMAPQWVIKD